VTTRGAALAAARARLAAAGIDGAALDARVLLCHVLGCGPEALVGWPEAPVGEAEARAYAALVERRARHEPVAYLVGHREFWGLSFLVSPVTLIPRPDSETLVEAALVGSPGAAVPRRILDIGTGTGCLLIALLSELPDAAGLGLDVVPAALELAAVNADRLGVSSRARWSLGGIPESELPFDLVVANLPYIPRGALTGLDPDVVDYEPASALDGGPDGLDAFRSVLSQLPRMLGPGGRALFEIGAGQASAVEEVAHGVAALACVRRWRDLAGLERVVELRRSVD
jgi:release factor glutamine methyltransferase